MNFTISEKSNGLMEFQSTEPFHFEQGGVIQPLTLVYETYGELSPRKDNAILVHHAISTNSHLTSSAKNPDKGWWDEMVGPGKAIDTNQFFVICVNNLGSCFGSSGPASVNPDTQKPYRLDFPPVTINDMVRSQQLLITCLGIEQLYAIVGNSMGAMLSLDWAIHFPNAVKKLISVSSCYRSYPVSIAYHTIQKQIIQLDPLWQNGYYTKNPEQGLKLARKVGLISYRDATDLNKRFMREGDIREYLEYNANKLAIRFDANSYMYLLDAMDDFDVTKNYEDPVEPFRKIRANTLVISVDSDVLFPPMQQEELYQQLQAAKADVRFLLLHSDFGHDAFYADVHISMQIKEFLEASVFVS